MLGKLVSVNYKLLILEKFLKWVSILFIIVFNIIGVYKFIFFFVVCCNWLWICKSCGLCNLSVLDLF